VATTARADSLDEAAKEYLLDILDARLKISDDWPEHMPVTETELDLFEVHFGPFLDELLGSNN
jgi:hypothetical protein